MPDGAESRPRPSGLGVYASGTVKDGCVSFDALRARLSALPHQKLPSTFWQLLHRLNIVLKTLELTSSTTTRSAARGASSRAPPTADPSAPLTIQILAPTMPASKRSRTCTTGAYSEDDHNSDRETHSFASTKEPWTPRLISASSSMSSDGKGHKRRQVSTTVDTTTAPSSSPCDRSSERIGSMSGARTETITPVRPPPKSGTTPTGGRVDWRAVAQLEAIANIAPTTPGEQLARALHALGDPMIQSKLGNFVCDVIDPSRLESFSPSGKEDLTRTSQYPFPTSESSPLAAWAEKEQRDKAELINLCRRVQALQDKELYVRYQRCFEGMRLVEEIIRLKTTSKKAWAYLRKAEPSLANSMTDNGFENICKRGAAFAVAWTFGCPYVALVLFFVTDGFTINATTSLGSAMEEMHSASTRPPSKTECKAGNATKKWSTDYPLKSAYFATAVDPYLRNGLQYLRAAVITLRALAPPIPITWKGEKLLLVGNDAKDYRSERTIYSVGGPRLSGYWAAKKHISNPDALFSSLRNEKIAMTSAEAARCLGKARGLGLVPRVNEATDKSILPEVEATDLGMQLLSSRPSAIEVQPNSSATNSNSSSSRHTFLQFSQRVVNKAISNAPFDKFVSIDAAMDCAQRLDAADPETLCESLDIDPLRWADTVPGPSNKRGALRQACMALGAQDWDTNSSDAEVRVFGPSHDRSPSFAPPTNTECECEALRQGQDRLRLLLIEDERLGNFENISTLKDFKAMHGRLGRSGGKKFRIKREFIEQYGAIIRDPLNPAEPLIVLHPAKVFPEAVKRSVESSIRDDLFFPPGPMRMEHEARLQRGEQAQASCMLGLQLRYQKAPYLIKAARDLGPVGGAVVAALHPVISYLEHSLKATSPKAHATLETAQSLARTTIDTVTGFQTNIAINWETVMGVHIDPDVTNAVCSLFVGGSFDGEDFSRGELCFHELGLIVECGDGLAVHFQSARLVHSTFPFSGSRYSVVLFTSQEFATKVAADRST
ncbi:BQ2448_6027 [Microbotryum intermedium]|uniref:BQ2448_6027 protein n=1 Tax=Microbotryum intermedium TaxID=269621 RepID=A0A238F5W7_9BASI|nr:BQ2448_6027 [Microbotryum intermedium]